MSWTYPSGFDAATALTYANFCQQAYFQYFIDSNTPPQFGYPPYTDVISIPPSGYTLLYDIYYNEGSSISPAWTYFGYVAEDSNNSGQLVFTIRGTENADEWMDNLLLSYTGPSGIANVKGNIHQGFAEIYQGLTYFKPGNTSNPVKLATILDGVSSIVVTGHSLGAALAILLTADIAVNYSQATPTLWCYTFAAPMVGDPTFANFFNGMLGATSGPAISAHYRIANGWDPVPNLPPNVFYFPIPDLDPETSVESDYMQVNSFCPIDSGVMTLIADPHSLTSYAIGLNYVITPPTKADLVQAQEKSLRGLAASLRSAQTDRQVRAATMNLRR